MNRKIGSYLLVLSLMLACTACGETPVVTQATKPAEEAVAATEMQTLAPTQAPEKPRTEPPVTEAPEAFVEKFTGTFVLDTSGQFSSSICRLKQMDEDLMLFELDVMESSEGENGVTRYVTAGTMLLSEQGTEGVYASDPDAKEALVIHFVFDGDGTGFTVTGPENRDFSPAGHYTRTEDSISVSEELAEQLLLQLPTAATGLSGTLGAYTMECSGELAADWFYEIRVVLEDGRQTAAAFLVARDLSCAIRTDEDLESVVIWGSTEQLPEAAKAALPD